jgi:hypothetical protein
MLLALNASLCFPSALVLGEEIGIGAKTQRTKQSWNQEGQLHIFLCVLVMRVCMAVCVCARACACMGVYLQTFGRKANSEHVSICCRKL